MKYNIRGENIEVTPALREYVQKNYLNLNVILIMEYKPMQM